MIALRLGDCLEVLRELDDASVDAVVTDPPYGINFMGKAWDGAAIEEAARREAASQRKMPPRLTGSPDNAHRSLVPRTGSAFANRAGEAGAYDFSVKGNRAFQQWVEQWASELYRVLKPGGHLVSFGGTRTYHRLTSGIEDAGFEIRDCLAWMFGSGFPKSLDVSKAIDAKAGIVRGQAGAVISENGSMGGLNYERTAKGEPVTAAAAAWDGWGTALKPAFEPIVLARKPLAGTVAANVLAHGTGALNVDGCRIDFRDEADERESKDKNRHQNFGSGARDNAVYGKDERTRAEQGNYDAEGRWPANVLLDADAARMLDEQTGWLHPPGNQTPRYQGGGTGNSVTLPRQEYQGPLAGHDGGGGASRFFYCAKVSRAERNAGLDGFEAHPLNWSSGEQSPGTFQSDGTDRTARNVHPTVKPIDLMRWLIRLVTPPGGVVLDPFLGSGSTGCAAALEQRAFIGLEREPDYMRIAEARIAFWAAHGEEGLAIVRARGAAERVRAEIADAGQTDIFDVLAEPA